MLSLNRDSIKNVTQANGGAFTVNAPSGVSPASDIEFVSIGEMPDYIPPFLVNGVKADLDANAWILTTAAGVSTGETLYDVVNNRGQLFQRVRIPAGRTIAGFGRGGIVYLKFKDSTNKWALERTRVVP